MSYSKFLDDLNDFYKDRHERGLKEKVSYEESQNVVRDQWLKDGRHQELISYVLENWDSGNCDDFIKPLVDILIQRRDSNLLKRLWKGVIRHRIEMARAYFSNLQEHFPDMKAEALDKVDLSNFNLRSSNEDIRRVAAFRRQFALNGISEFIGHLSQLGETEEIDRVKELYQSVYLMRKPTPKPSTDRRKITENIFWELIDGSREAVTDQYEFLDKLKLALEAFKPNEIWKFQKFLLTKLNELYSWEHWALAYIVRRGCGDDEFDYFRAWAVSKGRESFEAIKSLDTRNLRAIFSEDPQLEPLLSLAGTVYEEKTGEIMKEVKVRRSKLAGKEWSEENLVIEFPELCQLFEYPQ